MDQAVFAGQNIDESAEGLNTGHSTFINFPGFSLLAQRANPTDSIIDTILVSTRNKNGAVVVNVDDDIEIGHELFDDFAAGTNKLADFVHRNSDNMDFGSVLG